MQNRVEISLEPVQITQVVRNINEKLQEEWESPSFIKELKQGPKLCPNLDFDLSRVQAGYFECNKEIMKCLLQNKYLKENYLKVRDVSYNVELIDLPKVDIAINLKIQITGVHQISYRLKLDNSCKQVLLPERIYSYGETQDKNFLWDNIGRKIAIDKRPVTNQEVNEWIEVTKKYTELKVEKKLYPFFSTSLNGLQMREFCHDHGGNLLEAHLFQAATTFVHKTENKTPDYIYKYPYPWGREEKETLEFSEKLCRKLWSQECEKKVKRILFDDENNSWMGIYDVLGGELEYFFNPIESDFNLKASSKYFPLSSIWHKVGMFAQDDGQKFIFENASGDGEAPISEIPYQKIFRCYREVE